MIFPWFQSQAAYNVGGILTGLSAATATVLGTMTVSRELKAWKQREVKMRKAQAAAEVIIASRHLVAAVRYVGSTAVLEGDNSAPSLFGSKSTATINNLELRRKTMSGSVSLFEKAQVTAEVYLDDTTIKILEDLEEIYINQGVQFHIWASFLDGPTKGVKVAEDAYKYAFKESKELAKATHEKLAKHLRPIAHLE